MDTYRLAGVAERFLLEVRASPRILDERERVLAERAARALRFGLEGRGPGLVALVDALARALSLTPSPLGRQPREDSEGAGALLTLDRSLAVLGNQIADELLRGRIGVALEENQPPAERREDPDPQLPPLPPPRRERPETFFDVRFVDEVGQALAGVEVEYDLSGQIRTVTTNAAGVALLENVVQTSATVTVLDPQAVEEIVDPRWKTQRLGKFRKDSNTKEIVFDGGEISPVGVGAAIPQTVLIKPPLGKLFVELWDKSGRVRHAQRPYKIDGPATLEGTTDELGRLLHLEAFPGDYSLTFEVEVDAGNGPEIDAYASQLVVLPKTASSPEVRMLGAVPRSVLVRLRLLFNTNKAFLLPTALPGIKKMRTLYFRNSPAELLVVGHADTMSGNAYNDRLSLDRARAVIAYLRDDVDAWLDFYGAGMDTKQRWGSSEDRMMLLAMPDFTTKPKGENALSWFQRTRKLEVDGKAGPETRGQLVREYMALDGSTLLGTAVEATAHGCGENFPLDDTGKRDQSPADQKKDPSDRRVELFFFDREFGIVPPPPGPNSKAGSSQYPEWRRRALETHVFAAGDIDGPRTTFVELADALFRSNSAVVLPEGETPTRDGEAAESLQSVSAFAKLLRFNAENPGLKVLIAGHCDTTNTVEFNQTLSEERAACAHAVLTGDRAAFVALAEARHQVSDYKQILAWASRAFDDLVFDCDPGKIDDVAATGVEPVRRFQRAYNENKSALGATAADLALDGDVGPLAWGAFFDCYEFALEQELGEDKTGVAALRAKIEFVDPTNPSVGFSEHFPIEELGVDQYRSQANRRVEMLTFELGEEPDVAHALDDPETSELYLPGFFERVPLELDNALRGAAVDFIGVRGTTRYTGSSDFPKPSLLRFVKAIQDRLNQDPSLSVLLIGHADDVGVDQSPEALSLSRAELVKAWLTGDSATLLAKFSDGGPSRRWGFEELQWMLQLMPLGEFPCYVDRVDGYPGPNTLRALEYFQLDQGLPLSGFADDATLARLAQRYVELAEAPLAPLRVQTVGAGAQTKPLPFGEQKEPVFPDDAPQRLRRVEAILFPPPLNPSEVGLAIDPSIYGRWMRRVAETIDVSAPLPIPLALTDEVGEPFADAGFELLEVDGAGNLQTITSGFTGREGLALVEVPDGRYVVRAEGVQSALEVSADELGGQMLVMLPPLES
jgi:outer membrane protein OmpA-like peptidoglycan-associated protein